MREQNHGPQDASISSENVKFPEINQPIMTNRLVQIITVDETKLNRAQVELIFDKDSFTDPFLLVRDGWI